MKDTLLNKFKDRSAAIGIFGLGYVGLPLALRYAEAGFKVFGFDTDAEKVARLMAGRSYIERIGAARIAEARAAGFEATGDFACAAGLEALILCVPTPLNKYREPDLSFVLDTTERLLPCLAAGQALALESTTWPGTTEEALLPRVESTGLVAGRDIFLIYSPEREDPGNPDFNTRTIPKVVSGHTPACLAGISPNPVMIERHTNYL